MNNLPEKRKLLAGFFEEFKLVTGEGCKSSIKQLIEVFQLMLKCQYTPDEYYYYRFYEKDKNYAYMLNFMSNFYSLEYYHPKLNNPGWKKVISNKLIFNRYFGSLGVPVTKLYGYFDHQSGFTLDGMSLKTLCDLK